MYCVLCQQIEMATTDDNLQCVLAVCDAVVACGIIKSIASMTTDDKEEIVKLLCIRDVLFGPKSAIDQFVEGLDKVRLAALYIPSGLDSLVYKKSCDQGVFQPQYTRSISCSYKSSRW